MDTLHKIGDVVKCVAASGYPLTMGKEYTVTDVSRPIHEDSGFTFPSYVVVMGDNGKDCVCHHYRFVPA